MGPPPLPQWVHYLTWGSGLVLTGVALVLGALVWRLSRSWRAALVPLVLVLLLAGAWYQWHPLAPSLEDQRAGASERINQVAERLGTRVVSVQDRGPWYQQWSCRGVEWHGFEATLGSRFEQLPQDRAVKLLAPLGITKVWSNGADYNLVGQVGGSTVQLSAVPGRAVTVEANAPC